MHTLKRRTLLSGAVLLGTAGVTGLSACGNGEEGAPANLRFAWWGNPDRDERTRRAVAGFTSRTGRGVDTEPANWGDYWDPLATQIAGGNPPDLIQMDYQFIAEYAQRDNLRALDEYIPDPLDLGGFQEAAIDSGRVGGTLYGLTMGVNSFAMMSNLRVLADAGEDQPDDTITWSEFAALCRRIGDNTPDGVYGSQNCMGLKEAMECWLHQRGKALYTPDGQLAYDPDDLAQWWTYWMDLVQAGGCPDAETTAESLGDLSDAEVPQGTAAFNFHWSNIYTAFVEVTADDVGIGMYPQGDGPGAQPGQYLKASMLLSVPSAARDPQGAVELMQALVLDPEIARELGFERGVSSSEAVRDALVGDASAPELASLEYVASLDGRVAPVPPPPPPSAGEVDQEYVFFGQEVGFGRMALSDAVDEFFDKASSILA